MNGLGKNLAHFLDSKTEIEVYRILKKYYLKYLEIVTPIYRAYSPLKSRYIEFRSDKLKLHLGCGRVKKDGFVNIDLNKTIATDLVLDAKKLPFSDGSVERIENYHLVEHIPKDEFKEMLEEWLRVLEDGGKLVIECPNLDENMRNYLNGNNVETSLSYIFGSQRFKGDYHHWGYNFERLKSILKESGFSEVYEEEPQDYHKEQAPCLRVVAKK